MAGVYAGGNAHAARNARRLRFANEACLRACAAAWAKLRSVRTRLVVLLLAPLLVLACTPGQAADDPGGVVAAGTPEAMSAAPLSVVHQAEAIIGPRFGSNAGWIESIVRMEYGEDFVLKVFLDRPTSTLSQLDAYPQMCRALSELVASETNPDGILAVHFFRADGTPMVGTGTANSNCTRF